MMNRFPKVLLTLLLTLLLALSLSGCDLMVGTGPEAPIPPGVEQTGRSEYPRYAGGTPGIRIRRRRPTPPRSPGRTTPPPAARTATRRTRVRDGKPKPVEPETSQPDTSHQDTCTISISCATILNNMDKCDESKRGLVPADGVILPAVTVTFSQGESVFDVLQRVCKERKIPMEFSWTPMYNSAYIEGIYNLYEFDVGDGSGWMYKVNDWFPNYGCSRYQVQPAT